MQVPELHPVFTVQLLPPFSLQEAEVGLIGNKLCSLLYKHKTGKDRLVQEEMLCVGNFSTGTSICSVRPALLPALLVPFLWEGVVLAFAFFMETSELLISFSLDVFPGLCPPAVSPRNPLPQPAVYRNIHWKDPHPVSICTAYFTLFGDV